MPSVSLLDITGITALLPLFDGPRTTYEPDYLYEMKLCEEHYACMMQFIGHYFF